MIEHDIPLRLLDPGRLRGFRRLLGLVQYFKHAFRRSHGGLNNIGDVRGLGDRHRKLPGILDKRLHIADLDRLFGDENAADYRDEHISDVADKAHDRHDDAGNKLRLPAGLVQPAVDFIELLLRFALAAEHFNDLVPGVHFLDVTVQLAQLFLLPDELFLRPLGDRGDREHADRQSQDCDQGQKRADRQHHHDNADDRQDRSDQLGQTLLQGVADIVHIIRNPAQNFPVRPGIEVFQRQLVQFPVDVLAQIVDGLLGHAGH
ncbi:hypothetical protein D1872_212600 [compost metagenome]